MHDFLNFTENFHFLFALVVFLSVIQSIFGVGLVLFGTPILLILGFEFISVLSVLLPSSFFISALQIYDGKKEKIPIPHHLYFICLPAIGIGIWLGNIGLHLQFTDVFVGLILIAAALLRYFIVIQRQISKLFVDHNKLFHFLMGMTHGITNLGGSFLTIHASALHEKKSTIRYHVAYYYFAFSSIQLIWVFPLIANYSMFIHHMSLVIVSIIVYRLLGNTVFESATDKVYFHVFSLFMILCGITILVK
jgi:uncharacterized membrane protein YfcA